MADTRTTYRPQLIGLYSPRPQMGKSTAAKAIVNTLRPATVSLMPFAGNLKIACVEFLSTIGMDLAKANAAVYEAKDLGLPGYPDVTPRDLMVALGTTVGRKLFGIDLWVNANKMDIEAALAMGRNVVVDDCRYLNEARLIWDLGGKVVRVTKDPSRVFHPEATEALLEHLDFDFCLDNVGTKEALQIKVQDMLHGFQGSPS